ncbi:MAG: hypothetical protein O2962_06790, partial [Cyanobacteria bacterium]|nr:hypothetical protein [Cyanobacteriota bacterium]
ARVNGLAPERKADLNEMIQRILRDNQNERNQELTNQSTTLTAALNGNPFDNTRTPAEIAADRFSIG